MIRKSTNRISALLVSAVVLQSCQDDGRQGAAVPSSADSQAVSRQSEPNPYHGLRDLALSVKAQQLQLDDPDSSGRVYGVVMDWDVGSGIATLVSFETGDASVYLSSGGGFIGGRAHDSVKRAAREFVEFAQGFASGAKRADHTRLPGKNGLRFYFLTPSGKYAVEESMKYIENRSSWLLPLFEKANDVIGQSRLVSEVR